jgi:undecaprenyl-diphosphatase
VILGLLFGKAIKAHLFTPLVVASTFILGGFIILWAERRQANNPAVARIQAVEDMTPLDALKVGLAQCLAMIPGSLYKERALLSLADVPLFAVGLVVSFLSAWLCIRWLLRYIATHSFAGFAYYRIVFGCVVLATAWSGLVVWAA